MFEPIVFKNHLKVRASIEDERIWDVRYRWEKIIRYVGRDIPGFLAYVRDGMTEDELGWLSDVYEWDFPVSLVPGFAESLVAACGRMPECGARLGILPMLARHGFPVPEEFSRHLEMAVADTPVSVPVMEPLADRDLAGAVG